MHDLLVSSLILHSSAYAATAESNNLGFLEARSMSITENQVLDSPGSLFGSPVSIFGCIEDDDELDFASDSDDTYEDQEGVIEPDDDGSRQMDHASGHSSSEQSFNLT